MKSKHTKGVAAIKDRVWPYEVDINIDGLRVCQVKSFGTGFNDPTTESADANAQLIADAFNVTQETGLTPRELQKSHAELLEALKTARFDLILKGAREGAPMINNCDIAINNATK